MSWNTNLKLNNKVGLEEFRNVTLENDLTVEGTLTYGSLSPPIGNENLEQTLTIGNNAGSLGITNLGDVVISSSTPSTTSSTGSLLTNGGLGVAGNINATGDINSSGNMECVNFAVADINSTNNINATGTITGGNLSSSGSLTSNTAVVSLSATVGSVVSSGNITSNTGDLILTSGNIQASGNITSASGNIVTTSGNISSGNNITSTGDINAGGDFNGDNIFVTSQVIGNIITANSTVQAPNITATTGDLTVPNGDFIIGVGDAFMQGGDLNLGTGGDINLTSGNITLTSGNIELSDPTKYLELNGASGNIRLNADSLTSETITPVTQGVLKSGTSANSPVLLSMSSPVTNYITGDFTINNYYISTYRHYVLDGSGVLTVNIYDNDPFEPTTDNIGVEHYVSIEKVSGSWTVQLRLLNKSSVLSSEKFLYMDLSSGSIAGRNIVNTITFTVPQNQHCLKIKSCGNGFNTGGLGSMYFVEYM